MKRILSVIGLIALCIPIIGWGGDKGFQGQNKWKGPVYFQTNIVASGHKAGVTTNVSTSSTLTSAALSYGVINLQVGSAKTIGLNDGVAGQMITIICSVRDGANVVISRSAFPVTTHSTGWNTLTFDTQGDSITLLFMDNTIGWIVVGNAGVVIA